MSQRKMGPTFHQQFYYIMIVKMNGIQQWGNAISVNKHRVKMQQQKKRKAPLEDLGIHRKAIMKQFSAKQGVRFLDGFNCLSWYKPSDSIK
jgi:hypothetical protein